MCKPLWLVVLFVQSVASDYFDYIYSDVVLQVQSAFSAKTPFYRYTQADVIECIDRMHALFQDRKTHFAFVGDSRIRQQFYSFLAVLADYDAAWNGEPRRGAYAHYDMYVEFPLLHIRATYRWQPIMNSTLFQELTEWAMDPLHAPTFLLLGIGLHYMYPWNAGKVADYEEHLQIIKPIIRKLMDVTDVIWLHQVPSIEFYGHNDGHNVYVHQAKIEKYDELALKILRGAEVKVWTSMRPMALEYIRSCDGNDQRGDSMTFHSCRDYIHTGYKVIHESTQILVNHLCNKLMKPDVSRGWPMFG